MPGSKMPVSQPVDNTSLTRPSWSRTHAVARPVQCNFSTAQWLTCFDWAFDLLLPVNVERHSGQLFKRWSEEPHPKQCFDIAGLGVAPWPWLLFSVVNLLPFFSTGLSLEVLLATATASFWPFDRLSVVKIDFKHCRSNRSTSSVR